MSTFYLKNETGDAVTINDLGIILPDDTSLVIDSNEIPGYLSDDLIASFATPELVLSTTDVGDSGGDLNIADAQDALKITSRYDRDNPHTVTITQSITADAGTDITTVELEQLSDGSESALHIHDGRYYTEVEVAGSNSGAVNIHWDNITNAPQFGALEWKEPVFGNLTGMGAGGTEPGSPGIGDFFLDTDDDHLHQWDGATWVDLGAPTTGDRVIFKDGAGSDDKIYEWDGADWISEPVPLDNWAIIVSDDGDGNAAQYVYDSSGAPPDWIKIADVDWGSHNALADRTDTDSHPASASSYINTTSGLTADDVQDALDEIDSNVDTIDGDLTTHEGDTTNPHTVTFTQAVTADGGTNITVVEAETLTDGSDADDLHYHNADNTVYDNTASGLVATDVQDALDEVDVRLDSAEYRFANILYVDKNRNDSYTETGSISYPYKTIVAAMAAASAGYTVRVSGGSYYEDFTIPDKVTMEGTGRSRTIIHDNGGSGMTIGAGGPGSTVDMSGMSLRTPITVDAGDGVVDFENSFVSTEGFVVITTGDVRNLSVECTVSGTSAVTMGEDAVALIGDMCSFSSVGNVPVIVQDGGDLVLSECIITGASTGPLVDSNSPTLNLIHTSVINIGGGLAIDANNGANASTPNQLKSILHFGGIVLGNAVTYVEDVDGGDPVGTAIILTPSTQNGYDPTKEPSGLTSTNVQDAIDEIDSNVDTNETDITNHTGNTSNPHTVTFTQAVTADGGTNITTTEAETLSDGSDADALHYHNADNIVYDNTSSGMTATDVQDAIDELDVAIEAFQIPKGTTFPGSPTDADLFYRTDLNLTFQYDGSRTTWISMTHMFLDWGANVADGKYLRIHGATATQTGYLMPRNGVIISITAKCASGNQSKAFEIRRNHNSNTPLSSFSLVSGEYSTVSSNIAFSSGDYIQAFASSVGVPSRDIVIMTTIAYTG